MFYLSIIIFILQGCVSPPYYQNSAKGSSTTGKSTYKVHAGDTLFSIAFKHGVSYQDLAKYNNISTPYKIYPGQVIRLIPTGIGQSNGKNREVLSHKANSLYSKSVSSKNKTYTAKDSESKMLSNGSLVWQWPARGTILKRFLGASTLDKGIDIDGNLGEPVLAASSGQVVYAGTGLRGYGKLLILRHNNVFLSAYAHNSRLLVKEGDWVKAGQRIADMGSSGTNEVKLHFEIRREGTPEDPMKYLPKR